jgi:hypothetical protein
MDRTNIPLSKETRRQLRVLKAHEGRQSYDELLRDMIEDREGPKYD